VNVHSRRFPLVDSLRAIAALSIVVFHLTFALGGWANPTLGPYLRQLNVGVAVFFVISGFVLYRPFAAARLAAAPHPPFRGYAVRRILRIVPAYWVCLPVAALLLQTASEVFTPRGIVTYFGFLQIYDASTIIGGLGTAWSLCVEVTFYAALPLWVLLMRRLRGSFLRTELAGLAGLVAISVAWKLAIQSLPADAPGALTGQLMLPAFLDLFALGMALAVLTLAAPERLAAVDRAPWLPWLMAAGAFVLLGAGRDPGAIFDNGAVWQHELRGLIGVLLLLPAIAGMRHDDALRRLLALPALLWLGLVSYAIYLWHWPLIAALHRWGAPGVVVAVGAPLLTVVVAAASWYAVERPAQLWGRRQSGTPDPAPAAPAVAAERV
jgi:peptidoglycan/LPS O-acetylase OafA/YrhL